MCGIEWLIEASGCDPAALSDPEKMRILFSSLVRGLDLHPVGEPLWHQFPGPGGVTGLWLLAESHLACHTFPEHRSLCLNVFCCRPRPDFDFEKPLRGGFGAAAIRVRRLERPYQEGPEQADEPEGCELSELRGAHRVPLV